ncbi:MAG TPA: efflux RND transporter permease subunit, partial [Emcibacteraceae bacterium]|nr:efflux RND transporter permease subunit [Emcibacteraceae bacterium]
MAYSINNNGLGSFAIKHKLAIIFISLALCGIGIFAATTVPSSVFPQTNFPRVVILVDNGVMPANEMMSTITRPIEEAMKDIPGSVSVRSSTGRGSAEINVFFDWKTDMIQSELYVNSRLSQIRTVLPQTATTTIWRLTFSAFPIIGVSLTSPIRNSTELWEIARYDIKPKFLRIPGVGRVDLVGGSAPEYHIVIDPIKLQAANLNLQKVTFALEQNNILVPSGMHEEDYTLYLTVVNSRVHNITDLEKFPVTIVNGHPILIKDFAQVVRAPEPVFNVVTADGVSAVLLNVRSQPNGSTLSIADNLEQVLDELKTELPQDIKVAYYYDQSSFVRESVASVRDAIIFGLLLSVFIIYMFLKDWGITMTAIVVIPITILITLVAMQLAGLSFNLMTLGGIAAAIGLVIDDAIVVVEAIYAKIASGLSKLDAIKSAIGEIFGALIGSTLTPVVVFIPLAFLDGITGVFFRSLALTMVVALLTSLVLALTLTPSLAGWFIKDRFNKQQQGHKESGPLLKTVLGLYDKALRKSLNHIWIAIGLCAVVFILAVGLYKNLESEFLPPMDEGGFVIDYVAPFGTSLEETDRQLQQAEKILLSLPEVESYSRRTGARLALAIAEPNTGDFLVKLKSDRKRSTQDVITELRHKLTAAQPGIEWEFPGILSDLVGDLTWSPEPIEIKLFSTDVNLLKEKAPEIEAKISNIDGVVDTFNGLVYAGPNISFKVRPLDAQRAGLTAADIATAVHTAMLGQQASIMLEGDHIINIRVLEEPEKIDTLVKLKDMPIHTPDGNLVKLSQVADVVIEPGQMEMRREDLRQNVAVTARLEGRDLGSAMKEIQSVLNQELNVFPATIEYGGLYQQQQQSFKNLVFVLIVAIFLVFTVLLIEFRSFYEPIAIVFGAVLALFGTVLALWITGTSLNVVSFLGAIIGVGIVAKNGILML